MPYRTSQILWVVEDNAHCSAREVIAGVTASSKPDIIVALHKIAGAQRSTAGIIKYRPGSISKSAGVGSRALLALQLIRKVRPQKGVIVSGTFYGNDRRFTDALPSIGLDFVVQLRPRATLSPHDSEFTLGEKQCSIRTLLREASWKTVRSSHPLQRTLVVHSVAELGQATIGEVNNVRLFAMAIGGIRDGPKTIQCYATSLLHASKRCLVDIASWVRWIRLENRRKTNRGPASAANCNPGDTTRDAPHLSVPKLIDLAVRANITISRRQSEGEVGVLREAQQGRIPLRGVLARDRTSLTVVEIFAGAGGMGLGFLMANRSPVHYCIAFSGEVNPVCVETLRMNHAYLSAHISRRSEIRVPAHLEPLDLRTREALAKAREAASVKGEIDILIGGPPCQGFSCANKNSGSPANPHNALIETFIRYARVLQPKVLLMENVQGMLWTSPIESLQDRHTTMADYVAKGLRQAGYLIFPKILDAARYGVPQHRSRLFILGIHRDLGYSPDDFGEWGPFPKPSNGPGTSCGYVTVNQAIEDLPAIPNGASEPVLAYNDPTPEQIRVNTFLARVRNHAPSGVIFDHVASQHAEYVIDRYSQIPPGGNWQSITEKMTNYAAVNRTHSNIYRRLKWEETSITIGDYRKSMIVHPSQNRGLSVREAARLQSFPDWYRFAGGTKGSREGLMHKQKQLANAVCPFVAQAVAEFILGL